MNPGCHRRGGYSRRRVCVSYEIVWSYDVGPDAREAFERAYGSTGEWAQLFSRGDGFIEVVLLEDATVPGRYLTRKSVV